ncbi:MAG TPA: YihY/virulence factor BrkB family protein [Candidatus Saccharimonadales bacterium]|nr:YihY/virulence factor BrkB family protein [Candidatus Saccharimonadales bacterium]
MKIVDRLISKIDQYQKSHKWAGFVYAVIKKYGDDQGGYQAALLTYYGFLSIFPLLLAATSILQIILRSYPGLQHSIINHATNFFPVVGEQFQSNVHGLGSAGLVLVVSLLTTIWGAKGVADAFQYDMNRIWGVPRTERPGFPGKALKSLSVIFLGGIGLIVTAFLAGFASSIGRQTIFRVFSIIVSILLLFGIFWGVFKLGLASSSKVNRHALLRSALTAAIGTEILQIAGGYLVTHELNNLKHLYGTFAATLGLLFWIYLQSRVVIYSAEVGVVYGKNLWPRSMDEHRLTDADKRVLSGLAKNERLVPPQKVDVEFESRDQ